MRYQTIVVDGRNLLHRACYVGNALVTDLPDGRRNMPIGGVFQFIRSMVSVVDEHASTRSFVVVAWEGGETSRRREMWSLYKAGRTVYGPDSDFVVQETLLRDVLSRVGVSQVWSEGWEADDVIATLAARLKGRTVAILTGDHDLHQCVTDRVHVLDPNAKLSDLSDGSAWRVRDVVRKWSVDPVRIPEIKALAGDSSDGIPGASGIGDKGARGLMAAATLDQLLAAVENHTDDRATLTLVGSDGEVRLTPKKVATIRAESDQIRLFHRLCSVQRDVPLSFLPRLAEDPVPLFKRYRFATLLAPSILATLKRVVTL